MQIHELRLTQIFVKSEPNSLKAATPLPTMLTNPIISQICFCDVTRLCSIASNNLRVGFATTVIPRKYTLYVSTALFVFFGLKMLKEGYEMDPNEGQEELEEVQAELKKKEAEVSIVTCIKLVW